MRSSSSCVKPPQAPHSAKPSSASRATSASTSTALGLPCGAPRRADRDAEAAHQRLRRAHEARRGDRVDHRDRQRLRILDGVAATCAMTWPGPTAAAQASDKSGWRSVAGRSTLALAPVASAAEEHRASRRSRQIERGRSRHLEGQRAVSAERFRVVSRPPARSRTGRLPRRSMVLDREHMPGSARLLRARRN